MTTMTYFNTLHYVKKLEASGIPPAEAIAEAQQDAFSECVDNTLATKSDIAGVKNDIKEVKRDLSELSIEVRTGFKWTQWTMSILVAGVGALVLKTFF